MEKLIKLLNEYEENRPMELPRQYRRKGIPAFKWWLGAISEYDDEMVDNSDLLAISKFNWFIKRLVENDKIDLEEYKNESGLYTLKVIYWTDHYIDLLTNKVNSDFLLMLLSRQDNPIEFLVSIIK